MSIFEIAPHFKWRDNAVLFGTDKKHASWFTEASYAHFISGLLMFLIAKQYIEDDVKAIVYVNILHFIEDYMENNSNISLEAVFNRIIKCKNTLFLDTFDHDSLQNFIGDNISCLLGSLIGMYLYNNYEQVSTMSISMISMFVVIFLLTYGLICKSREECNCKEE